MFKVGDKVRIKNAEELRESPDWRFDPFMRVWQHVDRGQLIPEQLGVECTVIGWVGIEPHIYHIENTLGQRWLLLERLLTPLSICECSKEKFNFEWHEKWCPVWRSL